MLPMISEKEFCKHIEDDDFHYQATDGEPRFAHDEISAYYADGTTGTVETEYGIRGQT